MNRTFPRKLLVGLAGLLSLAASAHAQTQPQPTLSGIVVDCFTQKPIVGAGVAITNANKEILKDPQGKPLKVPSKTGGQYKFDFVPSGDFLVVCDATRYDQRDPAPLQYNLLKGASLDIQMVKRMDDNAPIDTAYLDAASATVLANAEKSDLRSVIKDFATLRQSGISAEGAVIVAKNISKDPKVATVPEVKAFADVDLAAAKKCDSLFADSIAKGDIQPEVVRWTRDMAEVAVQAAVHEVRKSDPKQQVNISALLEKAGGANFSDKVLDSAGIKKKGLQMEGPNR
jgi:hypothetical protein